MNPKSSKRLRKSTAKEPESVTNDINAEKDIEPASTDIEENDEDWEASSIEGEDDGQSEELEGGDDDNDSTLLEDDELVEEMDKLSINFEAVPPAEEDAEDIQRLIAQIFLSADVDSNGLAKAIIARAPMGCVYIPEEECEDEEAKSIAYGVLSMVGLGGDETFQSAIAELLLHRAKKFASSDVSKRLEQLLGRERASARIGLLINERMLNFPAQIAGPAFASLDTDYNSLPEADRFEHIIAILKVRICNESSSSNQQQAPKNGGKKRKKVGKAEKRRRLAAQLAEADTIFDNPEEQLLFTPAASSPAQQFPFFQYPVESEVEHSSKFHCIRRGGRVYRPFRRVCLLSQQQFLAFAGQVAQTGAP